jgi:ribosomal protein L11 methyltransferase
MWLALELEVAAAEVAALSDALLEEGALSVDVGDAHAGTAAETPVYREPGEAFDLAFGTNHLVALFEPDAEPLALLARACAQAGIEVPSNSRISQVEEQDWVRLTQSQFAPIRASGRLWIVPSWHAAPDPTAINIVLDPGLAFGTGSHPTTGLCLEWLDGHLAPGRSVIDYGCGSGILAIAAERLGAARVVGIDIDPQAVVAARYNAQRNDCSAQFFDAATAQLEPADVVVANILANPLRVLAPLLADLVLPGGHIVLSGILAEQSTEVSARYAPWFDIDPFAMRDGWARVSGVRRR